MLPPQAGNQMPDDNIEILTFGMFEFNFSEQKLKSDTDRVQLTKKEVTVLKMPCRYKNQLLKREVALKERYGVRTTI